MFVFISVELVSMCNYMLSLGIYSVELVSMSIYLLSVGIYLCRAGEHEYILVECGYLPL